MRIKRFLQSDLCSLILHWSFSIVCLIISLIHLVLLLWINYPGFSPAVVFAISALIFCPPIKAPGWTKFVLGVLLIIAT